MRILICAVCCLAIASCTTVEGGLSIDAEGWSVVTESPDTVKIYVSSSEGNDANDGLSEATAVASLAVGYDKLRDGYPDWLLLKRGDQWFEDRFTAEWTKSGRNEQERLVVSTYGDANAARPDVAYSGSIVVNEAVDVPCSYVAFIGLHLRNHVADPTSADYDPAVIPMAEENGSGIEWREEGAYVLVEDCKIRGFSNGVLAFNREDDTCDHFQIRRCQIIDNRGQGMLVRGQSHFLVEECLIDRNGWRVDRDSDVKEYAASTKKHNCYITNLNVHDVIFRGNVISRAGSHGVHFRPGGIFEDNLMIDNPISFETGYPNNIGEAGTVHDITVSCKRNVILHGIDINSTMNRGSAIIVKDCSQADIEDNIVAYCVSRDTNTYFIQLLEQYGGIVRGVTLKNNIAYDWVKGIRLLGTPEILENSGNYLWDIADPGPGNFKSEETNWVAPRTIWDYQRTLLPKGEFRRVSGFLNLARQQSKRNWDTRFQAADVISYVQGGFEIAP